MTSLESMIAVNETRSTLASSRLHMNAFPTFFQTVCSIAEQAAALLPPHFISWSMECIYYPYLNKHITPSCLRSLQAASVVPVTRFSGFQISPGRSRPPPTSQWHCSFSIMMAAGRWINIIRFPGGWTLHDKANCSKKLCVCKQLG